MKILLAGGGTGGHINPAIAIAQYFKSKNKDVEILFAGTPNGMEAKMVANAGFDFAPIEVMGFSRSMASEDVKHNLSAVAVMLRSMKTAKAIIKKFEPDVVIGTGGYVSGPIVYAASKMKVRTAIHEQNAFPGATTRFLANKVDVVLSAVAEARPRLSKNIKDFVVVGNPIRESIIMKTREEARAQMRLDDRIFVFSFGGSLGADKINLMMADLMEWNSKEKKFNHVHGYGKHGIQKFPALLNERGVDLNINRNIKIFEYIDDVDTCLAAADIVICRAGAITISEIQAIGKASILVPSPNVTANHQYHNAMVLEKKGACIVVEEKDYIKEDFIALFESLCNDKAKIKELEKKSAELGIIDSASRIYKSVMNIIN